MVNKIYDLKNRLLEKIEEEVAQRGIDRLDHDKVDMVKDLAQAECYCWKAEYYRKVSEAMEKPEGYGAGTGSSAGYATQGYTGGRQGYGYGERYNRGMMGYNDVVESIRMAIQSASPDEREKLRNEIKKTIGAM